ncbi:glycosyltransferase family 1 protein [Methylosinus sp. Sm6]|uniref:glycosyltransferase family 4 protein n=1 Tax=Methylosinus sp. Sm6 TaxID=2866948 RepID=UPI001C9902C3|nr:glycosyltransferase family 1 protein [Methylosinus sp. Sm6]MBY6241001.1 glycosyltransferase family 4 protein [Methylosinus sp. Sm6]
MDLATRIAVYLASEERQRERIRSAYELDPVTGYVYARAKEFYWTVTRAAGVSHRKEPPRRADPPPPLAGAVAPLLQRPRVLIDATAIRRSGERTGIQRVMREIARWAVATGDGLPVFIENGRLHAYYRRASLPDVVEPQRGDKLLMLDASFRFVDEYPAIMRRVAESGGETILGVHDILPLLYPGAFTADCFLDFQRWFETLAPQSDAFVCVSRSTAQSLADYLAERDGEAGRPRRIGWWRLGADFAIDGTEPSRSAIAIGAGRTPFFLAVGTLEPRKAYAVALTAFERLWAAGRDARFVIVGRRGWRFEALERRIRAHPELGRRLHWLDDADDASLRHLYERAHALIAASFAEGFGLPLAEAACHGLPAIASDIPVFREIAGERATFFPPLDADALADCIRCSLEDRRPRSPGRVVTWRESSQALLGMVRAGAYQWRPEPSAEAPPFAPVCVAGAAAS